MKTYNLQSTKKELDSVIKAFDFLIEFENDSVHYSANEKAIQLYRGE